MKCCLKAQVTGYSNLFNMAFVFCWAFARDLWDFPGLTVEALVLVSPEFEKHVCIYICMYIYTYTYIHIQV